MKRLIVTGDDFGLAEPVNEAIVEAHRNGILTTASLMVSGNAARDAVDRARLLPSLRVGLHVVVVEGRPVLPPDEVPDLVDSEGAFSTRLTLAGLNFFFRPAAREQLEKEIRAQFEAFKATGLALDHVNAHNHMHLHPTILSLILKVGPEFGLRAVRVPYEPPWLSWRASRQGLGCRLSWGLFLLPWMRLMKSRLRRNAIRCNDIVLGMADSGRMTPDLVLAFVREIPRGITEMYFHPAMRRCPEIDHTMPDYQHENEFRALTSPAIKDELLRRGIQRIAFMDL
jgi:hopanoid biosynthesis associated protein HpnK